VTRTDAAPTLFVTNLHHDAVEAIRLLMEREEGFVSFRTVRQMCFVDFESIIAANRVMRKYQGHIFENIPNREGGVLIDYDKDMREKRNREFEKSRLRAITKEDRKHLVTLFCRTCENELLQLRIPPPKTYATLPRRKTDGSITIDTEKYVVKVALAKGDAKAIKREKGIEKQCRLRCADCSVSVAYAAQPFTETLKHIFMLPEMIVDSISKKRSAAKCENIEPQTPEQLAAAERIQEREAAKQQFFEESKRKRANEVEELEQKKAAALAEKKAADEARAEEIQREKLAFFATREHKMQDNYLAVLKHHGAVDDPELPTVVQTPSEVQTAVKAPTRKATFFAPRPIPTKPTPKLPDNSNWDAPEFT